MLIRRWCLLFIVLFFAGFSLKSQDPGSAFVYEFKIAELNKKTPLELRYHEKVAYYIDLYLGERRESLEEMLSRSQYYFPIIEPILDKHELPIELKYLSVLESGLNPNAKSKSGAIGLWQFLYNTCSLFDLEVNSYIDERRDPYKSTEAACKYLNYLHNTFNDWNLVMASYNGGPGDVRQAIERSNGKTDYWEIRSKLSTQASNYVPAFIAFNYLFENYEQHGISFPDYKFPFESVDTIFIQYKLSLEQVAEVLEIPIQDLKTLNPEYRRNVIPERNEGSMLVLPSEKMVGFIKYENQILGLEIEKEDYLDLLENAGSTKYKVKMVYTVKPGDFYHKIAMQYNCTIENIKAWNKLNDQQLFPGQKLILWVSPNY